MPPVEILTFGGLRLLAGGAPVDWLASQRLRAAFIVFLAVERDVSRDRLTGMFWPEVANDRARRSLNQAIYSLRRSLGEETIITEGDRVRLGRVVSVDVKRFLDAAEAGDATAALREYRGRFLADASLSGSAEFEQWIDGRRAAFERQHRRLARSAIEGHLSAGELEPALRVAQQWCEEDPEEDEAHHRYLELLVQAGRRGEAVRHFDIYRKALEAAELEPLDETKALMAKVRGGRDGEAALVASAAKAPPPARVAGSPTPPATIQPRFSLYAELRRRGVIGTTSVYAVIAWACIEVATTVFTRLGLPEWAETFVIVLALLGFPFTVFFSWVYDVTPEGVRRASALPHLAGNRSQVGTRWLAGAVVLAAAGIGLWRFAGGASAAPSSGAVAIFPFCTLGAGLEGASEHVATLLAKQLDVLPDLSTTDPNVSLPAASDAKLNCRDAEAAGAIARKLGATQYLLGSITSAGSEIRATAYLYGAARDQKWGVTTSAAGPWVQVVDSLFREIVVAQGLTVKDRMMSAAATMTSSPDALMAFLEGESDMRRVDWKAATEHFRKAVALDSTYAAAWLRLAVALVSWGGPYDQRLHALEQAKRHAGDLQPREQALLHAFEPSLRGRPEAVERMRAYVAAYPDDAQGWFWLAETVVQLGAWADSDEGEAHRAYLRAGQLGNQEARFALAWDYWSMGNLAAMDSVMELIHTVNAQAGEWVLGLKAVRAFSSGDGRRVQAMLDTIDAQTEQIQLAATYWAAWAGNDSLRDRLLDRAVARSLSEDGRAEALTRAIAARVDQGRLRVARELISQLVKLRPEEALLSRAYLALNPALPRDPAELRQLQRELDAGSRAVRPDASGAASHYPARLLYYLARISLALGEPAVASAAATRLDGLPSSPETPNENALVAASIRAQLAATRGDLPAVRNLLAGRIIEAPFFVDRHNYDREDALPAELLARQRRFAEAARAYAETTGDYGQLVSKRRGELWEQAGDRARAVREYEQLRDRLRDCDPELGPLRDWAAERAARLRGSGRGP